MKIRRSKWVSRIGAVGLAVGCLALAGFGSGATPAEAEDSPAAASRFVVLEAINNEAVLDNETGLVWETIPARAADGLEKCRRYLCEKDRRWQERTGACPQSKSWRPWRITRYILPPPSRLAIPFPTSSFMAIGRRRSTKTIR